MALVKLESFEFTWEAELVRALLESEGIQAFVFDAEHIRLNWALSNALGGVRVMVNSSDFDVANKILITWRSGAYEESMELDINNDLLSKAQNTVKSLDEKTFNHHCDSCGSNKISPIYNKWKTLLFFFLVGPAPARRIGYQCKRCNHKEIFQ